MLTALVVLILAVAILAAILFAVVVVGIRNEPHAKLRRHAPGPIAALSRRMLGVYVSKPGDVYTPHEEPCLAGHGHATPRNKEGDAR
jgi:hypothetical protein